MQASLHTLLSRTRSRYRPGQVLVSHGHVVSGLHFWGVAAADGP
jgi:hypothetical protein